MLGANIQKDDAQVQLINIYSPNKPQERPQFFLNISKFLDPKLNIIFGGDFNMVLNVNMDRAGGTPSPTHYPDRKKFWMNINYVTSWEH